LASASVVLDEKFTVVAANRLACALFNRGAELLGTDLRQRLIAPASLEQLAAASAREPGARTVSLPLAANEKGPARFTAVTLAGESGRSNLLLIATNDSNQDDPAATGPAPRMVAVSRLAGGMAHDFNNVLQTILGRATLLEEFVSDGEAGEHLGELSRAAQRAQRLVQQLLTFGRQQTSAPIRMGFDALVARSATAATSGLPHSIDLEIAHDAAGIDIAIDPVQFDRVIAQVVANAEQAMNGVGRLRVCTSVVARDDAMAHTLPFVGEGRYACVSLIDTGPGIDPALLPFIFEPFFTTKKPSHAGMGLAEAYGIVKQSNGFILVDKAPESGARVRILFPLLAAPVMDQAMAGTRMPSVLVVEDDRVLGSAIAEIMLRDNYQVLEANSSAEAFLRAELHSGSIDLLITDLALGDVGGSELAMRLRVLYPNIRVVFVDGDVTDMNTLQPGEAMLDESFTPDALRRVARRLLAADRPVLP
jgi:signal transduction histidine kinase/CheY-like chemotaxis protein